MIMDDWFFYFLVFVCLFLVVQAICLVFADGDLSLLLLEKFGKPLSNFHGKVVWITGASSGLGETLAVEIAKYGGKLVLSARRESELARVKEKCLAVSNGRLSNEDVFVLPFDMTDFSMHNKCWNAVLEHFHSLDILVHNAGRSQRAEWKDIDIEVDRAMFELDVFSTLSLTRLVLPYFLERGNGHIAVTSSGAGKVPISSSASYVGAKFALHGYYDSLRTEYSSNGVAVTMMCPGPTRTSFLQECFTDKVGQKYGKYIKDSDRRMSAERCGYLMAVSIINKVEESWIAHQPSLMLMYIMQYFPTFGKRLLAFTGKKFLLKLREGRKDAVLSKEK